MRHPEYDQNVFINCPFDSDYTPLFEAVVFTLHDLGCRPKCARERFDSSEIRLQKIAELISISRYSIHDLSRTTLDEVSSLPRFNMPLELGIDLGCKLFSPHHRDKSLLILDSERHRFQKYASDISGQDIDHHGGDPCTAVKCIRNWYRAESGRSSVPGGDVIYARYEEFRADLPAIRSALRFDQTDLIFADFSFAIAYWLERHS
jgi:hypothetical protein